MFLPLTFRLFETVSQEQKLYLVFEFLDLDLKRYMDKLGEPGSGDDGLGPAMIKVRLSQLASEHRVIQLLCIVLPHLAPGARDLN